MKNTVSIDVLYSVDKIYGRMQDNYSFAFPKDSLEAARVHQVLCRFGVFCSTLSSIFNKDVIFSSDSVENVFFKQVLGNAKVISTDKEWAYPEGNLSEGRAHSTLNCIESSLKNYRNSIQILGQHCFKNKTADFDLVSFIDNISCSHYYNYAYPSNNYSESKAHPAFQMLLTLCENIQFVIESVKTEDEDLKNIVTLMAEKMETTRGHLTKAYPNSSFVNGMGHQCLSQFINSWKNFKEVSLTSLKTYFEKKNIIADYEEKLKIHSVISNQDPETNKILSEIVSVEKEVSIGDAPVPFVRKVKSLL